MLDTNNHMAKSIKTNYILNLVNTGSQFLFPLITLPYASRIMGPEGIGLVNFYQSIISYVILIAGLGIPMYGIKEIARVRDNKDLLSQTTLEILLLHSGLTIIAYIVIGLLVLFVPQINSNTLLFLLLSLSVLFTTIGCDWFFKGIEDFKYITIRGIVVKSIAVALLFLFVKEKDDILWYGFYCVFGTLGGNLFNFYRLNKILEVKHFNYGLERITKHIKPVFQVFIFSIVTSLYLNMNPVLLGFIKGEAAVGYYTAGLKLFSVATSIAGSLAVVMLPRASYLIAEGRSDEFRVLIQKAYNFSIGIALPLCAFFIFVSPCAIRLLFGDAFGPSIICAQVLSPIVIFLSISSLMGTQVLYPMGKIGVINNFCAIGAGIDIVLSIILVPLFAQLGTSISYSTTELSVMILSIYASRKYFTIQMFNNNVKHYVIGTVILSAGLFLLSFINLNDFIRLIIIGVTSLLLYASYLIVVKDQLMRSALSILKR
jgi:O-antigen/teichoic acid export membrane protein